MGDWPTFGWCSRVKNYPVAGSTYFYSAQTGTTANTKGAWKEIIATTPFDGLVNIRHLEYYNPDTYLWDLGVGSAGSEVVVIENIIANFEKSYNPQQFILPYMIPAGSRVAVRVQYDGTSDRFVPFNAGMMECNGWGRAHNLAAAFETVGANTADSTGTELDSGATANTYPAAPYTQITSATANDWRGFYVLLGFQANALPGDASHQIQIAVGASSSETVIVSELPRRSQDNPPRSSMAFSPYFGIDIPAGTRLSARQRSTVTGTADRKCEIVLLGVRR